MYSLAKMSSDGFEMFSESLCELLSVLEGYICHECFMNEVLPEYCELPTSEQIQELLWTPCGAEFIFRDNAKQPVEDPYKRRWHCQEKMSGYLVTLTVGDKQVNEFIDRHHWEHHLHQPDLFRCTIQRLQRKMFYRVFQTYRGRFQCDWEL